MSHFTVMVIGENPEKQLAPFQENNMGDYPEEYLKFIEDEYCDLDERAGKKGYWGNPNAKWDWYLLGGRWTGLLKLKEGGKGKSGKPGLMTDRALDGYCDQALKRDIDIDFMISESIKKASDRYDKAMSFIGNLPSNKPWKQVREEISDISEARLFYWNQPRCVTSMEEQCRYIFGHEGPDEFLISKEDFVEKAKNNSICTHAIIKDGKWFERGEMGWWGVIVNETDDWEKEFAKLFSQIPDDTLISIYDCHI